MDFRLIILFGITMIVSLFAQSYVKSSYQKYSRIGTFRGMTGAQVAKYILDRNNLNDVSVIESRGGVLSDHFDPAKKTVALSKDVYHNASIASVAVAAHEVGHAIQYATGYHGIKVRNLLLKPTLVASQFSQVALIIGLITSSFFLELGIIMLAVIVVFQIITLPIEFDASSRALKIIEAEHIVDAGEYQGAKTMLNAAALTYVAAALGSVVNLLYFLFLRNSRRD